MAQFVILMLLMLHEAIPRAMAAAPTFPTAEWKLVEYVEKLNDRKTVCDADKMVDERLRALEKEGIISCIQQGGLPIRSGDEGKVYLGSFAILKGGSLALTLGAAAGLAYAIAIGGVIYFSVRKRCQWWNGTERELRFMNKLKTTLAPKVADHGCNRP